MTKEEKREYDRKYYQANKEKKRKYRLEHADEIREQKKQYYLEHADECKEYQKQYRLEHADERKQYRLEHADEIREKDKQYYLEHADERKQCQKQYQKQYRQTKEGRATYLVNNYNRIDKAKGFDVSENITADWILKNIFTAACIYCGENDWRKLGTDRIDNTKPHTPENCVCCCEKCNKQRGDRYTFEEFVKIKREGSRRSLPEPSP